MAENFSPTNMRYYAHGAEVPKDAQKDFNNGSFSGTDINPMWRIRTLTEMFGPAGIGWYTEVLSERQEQITEDHTICIVDLNLYVKVDGEWSKPIFGTGGNTLKTKTSKGYIKSTDEGYKMAYTDALGVACKALGIGAKVYWSKDKTKYDDYLNDEAPDDPAPTPASRKTASTPTPVPAPAPLTGDVKFEADPAEVTAEMLETIVQYARGPKEQRTSASDNEFAKVIKDVNGGKPNYRTIKDDETRKAVYIAIYNKYISKEETANA